MNRAWDEHDRQYEAWRERQYLRHALVATLTHDQQAAERASAVLADDTPPRAPFQATGEGEDERWSDARLEADLLMGTTWPFFRDKSLDHLNGHHLDDDQGEEHPP